MFLAVIAGAVAVYLGWHFSQAHMAHRAIPGRKSQFGGLRRDRTHHLIWVLGIGILFVVIFLAVVR